TPTASQGRGPTSTRPTASCGSGPVRRHGRSASVSRCPAPCPRPTSGSRCRSSTGRAGPRPGLSRRPPRPLPAGPPSGSRCATPRRTSSPAPRSTDRTSHVTSDRLHPRPQLTRDAWIDLDGEWGFASDPDDRGLVEGWWRRAEPFDRTILVPFPPESAASGIEEPLQRIVWYRREIGPLDVPDGHRVLLHLTAVDHLADVWVDGQHVARHEGGHTSFSIDITRAVTPDRPVALVVRALDEPSALDQPRGKQDWE